MRATARLLGISFVLFGSAAAAQQDPTGPNASPATDSASKDPTPDWEGPLPADRDHGLDDPVARGIWLAASAQAAWFDRDPWITAALRAGFQHRWFALHIVVPFHLRVVDLPPHHQDQSWPAMIGNAIPIDACRWLRCAQLQRRPAEISPSTALPPLPGGLEPLRLLSLIDTLNVGQQDGPIFFRLAPQRQTLGDGTLIRGVLSQPLAGIPVPGARAAFSFFSGTLEGQALIADATRPWELLGGQLTVRPFALFESEISWMDRLIRRFEVGAQMATDLTAPALPAALDTYGDTVDWRLTRPVLSGATHAAIDLQTPNSMFAVRPHAAIATFYGLTSPGSGTPALGLAGEVGLQGRASLPWVGMSASVVAGLDSPGARTGLFSTLYLLERRRTLSAATSAGAGALALPAPGGLHARGRFEFVILDILRGGLSGQLGSSPGTDAVEFFLALAVYGMRGSVSVVKRLGHRPMHLPSPDQTLDLVRLDTSWWSVAEFMAPIWGPLSLYGRWVHAPRFVANHKLRSDDDVTFGLSAAVALDSPLLDLL